MSEDARATDSHRESAADSTSRQQAIRAAMVTWFPMLIAVLSLITSIFNGYLNNKFVNTIRGRLTQSEYMSTCRETIDAYFQVKYRAGVVARANAAVSGVGSPAAGVTTVGSPAVGSSPPVSTAQASGPPSAADIEAGNAVARFGALATYLANLRDEKIRASYTELYWILDRLVATAASSTPDERRQAIAKADAIFYALNADCIKAAEVRG
ncbi:MAG: hypothetical protein KDJ37_02785 [Hyphomicrobiaceae bacterium]|nr:hypothetical protein [Hyphomicrobiaceae bacterium]